MFLHTHAANLPLLKKKKKKEEEGAIKKDSVKASGASAGGLG